MRPLPVALGVLAVAVAYVYRRQLAPELAASLDAGLLELSTEVYDMATGYSPVKVPEQYRASIAAAEQVYGLPVGLLARVLYQESRFRPDIISGAVRSPVGALGIAQFMPATAAEWGVDPLDPASAIPGAARYLAWLYGRVGGWPEAVAAYNWGIGNVQRKGLAVAPKETRDYYTQILADVGLGGLLA